MLYNLLLQESEGNVRGLNTSDANCIKEAYKTEAWHHLWSHAGMTQLLSQRTFDFLSKLFINLT